MKKLLINFFNFLQNIILFIINLFFGSNPNQASQNKNNEKNTLSKSQNEINLKKKEEDTSSDSSRELFHEYINKLKRFNISREQIDIELNRIIEKIFKIRIKDLSNIEKKELNEYKKKTIIKVEEKIKDQKINNIEELKLELEERIKKDISHKNKNEKKEVPKITDNNPEIENNKNMDNFINQSIEEIPPKIKRTDHIVYSNKTLNQENKSSNVIPTTISLSSYNKNINNTPIDNKKLPNKVESPTKLNVYQSKTEIKPHSEIDNTLFPNQENDLYVKSNLEEQTILDDTPIIENFKTENEPKENNDHKPKPSNEKPEKEINEKQKKVEKPQEEKKTIQTIQINLPEITNQNKIVIEKAKDEYNKNEFIEKDYDLVEKLLTDKIYELENILNKPLQPEQKEKLKSELHSLKTTREQVVLHKEKDLEEIRISLEESIPYQEILIVNQKLKEFHDNAEREKKEIIYQNLEKKSQEDLKKLEKILIKKSLKKAIKPLDLPLYFSFPFIKNKFFRKFVSGLFVFRSFQFIKSLLFQNPLEYEPIDLNYIQTGKNALDESISITEKNIKDFENVKQLTLMKYPELAEDEEFIIYVTQLEENLNKNYEKLLKHEKVVNKYFNKSKKLIKKKKTC